MSETAASNSGGVRRAFEHGRGNCQNTSICPPSHSRFWSVRSSRVGGRGDQGCVDDPTKRIGSARERDVQVDGWMKGQRANCMKGFGRRCGPATTPPTSLLSLRVSLSLTLYPPPSTPYHTSWWHRWPRPAGATPPLSVSWLNCLSLRLIYCGCSPPYLDVTCAPLLCTVLQKPLMWRSFVEYLSPTPLLFPYTPPLTPSVLMAAALSSCSLNCTAYFLKPF